MHTPLNVITILIIWGGHFNDLIVAILLDVTGWQIIVLSFRKSWTQNFHI